MCHFMSQQRQTIASRDLYTYILTPKFTWLQECFSYKMMSAWKKNSSDPTLMMTFYLSIIIKYNNIDLLVCFPPFLLGNNIIAQALPEK